ncbi:MAG: MFS transporter [candidate division KSB1 bacterium]|nr:MFS transporter [candidate division KSB1 bacterium]MDZ7366581.1 MFS transporter [candidate division KSB1 bacterium]MDZ7406701.1 MFS transporter [candidate division KSB1 bacterium]
MERPAKKLADANGIGKGRHPWFWVPTLYFAEGIPYVVVMTVSVIMYKRMGISNTDIALYTSWLYLPWVIKPLWSPLVDIFKTKRFWIILMQLIVGAGLGGVALTIPLPDFFKYTLAFLWLLAFSSATHDIAADGFYMLGLSKHQQAWFVGIRSTFYRLAMITGQGLLIILAGYIESHSGLPSVEVTVSSKPAAQTIAALHPDSILITPAAGDLRIVALPTNLEINISPRRKNEADSIMAFAKAWNLKNGFYAEEKRAQLAGAPKEPSWWRRVIVTNLEAFLKKHFGPEEKAARPSDQAGNVGILFFHLSNKPGAGKEVVVNFGRESGDNSIGLAEGSRFVFNERNWNKPMMAVIQLDPKLKTASSAVFHARAGNIPLAWSITFFVLTGMFFLFFIYHRFILPHPASDAPALSNKSKSILREFFMTFASFFKKKNIGVILAFLLLYRFAEAQLVKLASPFLLDAQEVGGMALTTGQVGFVYGTVGIIALTLGGLLGGFVAARNGLKFWLWWMVLAINLPDAVYVYLAYALPDNFWTINLCVAIEQFGYGFGFTAYMLYMIYISEGDHKTAHFAICTGFMALGMMLPGMFSGWLQDIIGYQNFFVWVMLATIPGFIATTFIPLDPEFGKKAK